MQEIEKSVKKKVIFVNRFFYPDHSATSQLLSDLAFDLVEEGYRVEIVTSRLRYDDSSARLLCKETVNGVLVHRVWTSRFGRGNLAGRALDYITFYVTAAWSLLARTDSNTIVIAKTDPPLISVIAAVVTKLRKAVLINWLQDVFPEVAEELGVKLVRGKTLRVLKTVRNATLRNAHTNIVLGKSMEQFVRKEVGGNIGIHIIPNWADGRAIKPISREENPLRSEWGLQGKFVVGYSGNLGRAHEFETILYAAEILSKHKDVVFLFIGGGAQRELLEFEARRRCLDSIGFQPYQPRERLSESLSAADVHLVSLSPRLEGLIVPSKIYGILAVGRPTIFVGDANGEVADLLRQNNCGSSVNVSDGDKLAYLIMKLSESPDLAKKQEINARALFDKEYSRRIVRNKWLEILSV